LQRPAHEPDGGEGGTATWHSSNLPSSIHVRYRRRKLVEQIWRGTAYVCVEGFDDGAWALVGGVACCSRDRGLRWIAAAAGSYPKRTPTLPRAIATITGQSLRAVCRSNYRTQRCYGFNPRLDADFRNIDCGGGIVDRGRRLAERGKVSLRNGATC